MLTAPTQAPLVYRVTRTSLRLLTSLLCRPIVEGRDNIPADGPVILASNHLSFIDSIIIPLVAPRRVMFLAKAEYFHGHGLRTRVTRTVFTALGSVPVDRGTHRGAAESLEVALEVLADGLAFGIYPEGTRSRDGRLYRGRTGVAWLALTAPAPVVPVGVIGTDRMQPVGARLPRPHRVTVRFGAPMSFVDRDVSSPGRARRQITDEIMAAVGALSGQVVADRYNVTSASSTD